MQTSTDYELQGPDKPITLNQELLNALVLIQWELPTRSSSSRRAFSGSRKKKTSQQTIRIGPQYVNRVPQPRPSDFCAQFWELPESTEDTFSLFSPSDIRRTRDTALENLETLILAITSRLFILRHHPSFPDQDLAPERDALNCIRILTRVLPYVYETDHLQEWEDRFFWGARRKRTRKSSLAGEVLFDEALDHEDETTAKSADGEFEELKPLAEELIDTLIDLVSGGLWTSIQSLWQKLTGDGSFSLPTLLFQGHRTARIRCPMQYGKAVLGATRQWARAKNSKTIAPKS